MWVRRCVRAAIAASILFCPEESQTKIFTEVDDTPPTAPPHAPLCHCVVLLLSYQHKEPERLYPEPLVEGPAAPCPCSPWSRHGRTSLSTACVCWLWKRRSKLINFFCILDFLLAEYWQGTKSSLQSQERCLCQMEKDKSAERRLLFLFFLLNTVLSSCRPQWLMSQCFAADRGTNAGLRVKIVKNVLISAWLYIWQRLV